MQWFQERWVNFAMWLILINIKWLFLNHPFPNWANAPFLYTPWKQKRYIGNDWVFKSLKNCLRHGMCLLFHLNNRSYQFAKQQLMPSNRSGFLTNRIVEFSVFTEVTWKSVTLGQGYSWKLAVGRVFANWLLNDK